MFLGDSLVWGFDVEASERFTEKLQVRHPEWNIYNLGVSGYGTDQEFLLWQRYFYHYRPRAVILVFCTDNDVDDNAHNARNGGYYKPYFTLVSSNALGLHGIPVPRGERAVLSDHQLLSRFYLGRLVVRFYCKGRTPPLIQVVANPIQVVANPTGHIISAMRSYIVRKG